MTGFITLLKDIALIAAAITAIYVGIKGLGTWRRQLRGNTEYTLAKNILTSMYELREAISGVRNPFMMYSSEPDLPQEELDELSQKEKEWLALAQAYQKRLEPIPAARAKLKANLLEAEAVWGHDLVAKINPLFRLIKELWLAIQEHLEARTPTIPYESPGSDIIKKRHAILYEGDPEKDDFKNQLEDAIRKVEIELKPHITQYHN